MFSETSELNIFNYNRVMKINLHEANNGDDQRDAVHLSALDPFQASWPPQQDEYPGAQETHIIVEQLNALLEGKIGNT